VGGKSDCAVCLTSAVNIATAQLYKINVYRGVTLCVSGIKDITNNIYSVDKVN